MLTLAHMFIETLLGSAMQQLMRSEYSHTNISPISTIAFMQDNIFASHILGWWTNGC